MKTTTVNKENLKPSWHLIDLENKVLGRIAPVIVIKLMGKNKVNYVPHINCGDNVVVINSKKVVVTGNKELGKVYYSHSGYVGNLKERTVAQLRETNPNRIIYEAVKGMLPKNKLRDVRLANLHIFEGKEHSFSNKFDDQN